MRIFTEKTKARLYFYNFNNNTLQDANTISVQIKFSNLFIASLNPIRESTGVYYVDYFIPSSDPNDIFFDINFPGEGVYEDVWNVDGNQFVQNFIVKKEISLPTTEEPLTFTYQLINTEINKGSDDYLQFLVNNSVLTLDQFPPLFIKILNSSNATVIDFKPTIKFDNRYYFKLNSKLLPPGTYFAQGKIIVPEQRINKKAIITSNNNLPVVPQSSIEILDLEIDGIRNLIQFPNTGKKAQLIFTLPQTINFIEAGNDVFIINVDGEERKIRLVNTPVQKSAQNIVDEMNGLYTFLNSLYDVSNLIYPIVTGSKDLSNFDVSQLNGKDLKIQIDNEFISIEFANLSSNDTLLSVANIINNAINEKIGRNNICYIVSNSSTNIKIIVFAENISTPSQNRIKTIKVLGGTSLYDLGFIINQDDNNVHKISDSIVSVTLDSGKIKIQSTKSFKIYNFSQGSKFNVFTPGDYNIVNATPCILTSDNSSFPIKVVEEKAPIFIGTRQLSKLTRTERKNLNLETITVERQGVSGYPLTISLDNVSPPAIVSPLKLNSYNISANSIFRIVDDTTNIDVTLNSSSSEKVLTLNQIINILNSNTSFSNVYVADIYNFALRIRRKNKYGNFATSTKIIYSSTYKGGADLGFNLFPDPENTFQNDEVINDTTNSQVIFKDYKMPISNDILISIINSALTNQNEFSFINNDFLAFTSIDKGSNVSIRVYASSGAASILGLPSSAGSFINGEDPLNRDMNIKVINTSTNTVIGESNVEFEEGYRMQDYIISKINSVTEFVTTSKTSDNKIEIRTQNTGSNIKIEITSNSWDSKRFGFSADYSNNKVSKQNGTDFQPAIALSKTITPMFTKSSDNGFLYIKTNPNLDFTIVNLSGVTSINDFVNRLISSGLANDLDILTDQNKVILIHKVLSSNAIISIASADAGSTANGSLGISANGITVRGVDTNSYSIDNIVSFINGAFGREVSKNSGGFLEINSINSGSLSYVKIGENSTHTLLIQLGLVPGKIYGSTRFRDRQEIVLNKIQFRII